MFLANKNFLIILIIGFFAQLLSTAFYFYLIFSTNSFIFTNFTNPSFELVILPLFMVDTSLSIVIYALLIRFIFNSDFRDKLSLFLALIIGSLIPMVIVDTAFILKYSFEKIFIVLHFIAFIIGIMFGIVSLPKLFIVNYKYDISLLPVEESYKFNYKLVLSIMLLVLYLTFLFGLDFEVLFLMSLNYDIIVVTSLINPAFIYYLIIINVILAMIIGTYLILVYRFIKRPLLSVYQGVAFFLSLIFFRISYFFYFYEKLENFNLFIIVGLFLWLLLGLFIISAFSAVKFYFSKIFAVFSVIYWLSILLMPILAFVRYTILYFSFQ